MNRANYAIDMATDEYILLQDVGPHDEFLTITNDIESVVENMRDLLRGRKLYYLSSDGETVGVLIDKNEFSGFYFPDSKTLARGSAKGSERDELVKKNVQLAKRVEELETCINNVISGNYPNPSDYRPKVCPHSRPYYEPCDECLDQYLMSVIRGVAK